MKIGTVAELKRRITAHEAAEWRAYERIYGPLGHRHNDWLAAQIEAAIFNSQRVRGEPIQVPDCVFFGPPIPRPPQDIGDMKRAARMAGTVKSRKVRLAKKR